VVASPVELVALDEAPGVAFLPHPDDRAAHPGLLARDLLLGLLGRALGVRVTGPEHGVYVLVVDPEDAVLGVLAALQGVYREVGHEVVVVAVDQAAAERVAGRADDLVAETLGQHDLVGVGRLYGLEEGRTSTALRGRSLPVGGAGLRRLVLLALGAARQHA
jgi:hypothetical protein